MDPPGDPPPFNGRSLSANNIDPVGLSINASSLQFNTNTNDPTSRPVNSSIATCIYEARRPLRLNQYVDGMSNEGYFFVDGGW